MTDVQDHTKRKHSKLGASGAHRWIACPGSVRATEDLPDNPSVYAAWGTVAHEIAQKCLEGNEGPEVFHDRTFKVDGFKITVDEEMVETVGVYIDYVREKAYGNDLHVEEEFSLELVYPGMFGTNDSSIYDAKAQTLEVIDFKAGKGKAVEVEDNAQLKYYAFGALLKYQHLGVSNVKLTIVQPRAIHRDGPIRSWETTPMDLMIWSDELRDHAKATEDPKAPLVPGDHCQFCAFAPTCPALKAYALKAAMADFASHPSELGDGDLTTLLREVHRVEDWIRAVKQYVFERMQQGKPVPGYKLVAKRAIRRWAAPEFDIISAMEEHGVPTERAYKRELLSPAQMEKLLPKDQRDILSDFIEKRSSGVTIAPEDDKRPAVDPGTASDDFDPVD